MGWKDGVRFPRKGKRCFSSPRRPDRFWGQFSLLSNWYWRALSPGVKRQGHEADHLPPSNAGVKNVGAIYPLPQLSSWHDA
jgi:hypothetical protein